MSEEKIVDVPSKAQPLGPGDPVEHDAASQMGGTFAERKAAREKAEKASSKAVSSDSDSTENKSVTRKRTSRK